MRAKTATLGTRLGQRIRELREALSLTQEELAQRAKISVSFISMIERANRVPHVKTLAVLAGALGITLSQLFVGVNESRTSDPVTTELPLLAYLGNLRLRQDDVDALLKVAKAMFDGRP